MQTSVGKDTAFEKRNNNSNTVHARVHRHMSPRCQTHEACKVEKYSKQTFFFIITTWLICPLCNILPSHCIWAKNKMPPKGWRISRPLYHNVSLKINCSEKVPSSQRKASRSNRPLSDTFLLTWNKWQWEHTQSSLLQWTQLPSMFDYKLQEFLAPTPVFNTTISETWELERDHMSSLDK